MPKRNAQAEWTGDLLTGKGNVEFGSGAFKGAYSFKTRFEDDEAGTNPEELIAAAHAGCFSMAFSAVLGDAGFKPNSIKTTAQVTVVKSADGFSITKSELNTEADIPGIDEATFQEKANAAKAGCPVSKALAGVEITLNAKLV